MAKRRSEDEPEIVKQLRPDDTGWLAELRRAQTDPVDLAAGADDGDPPSDPPAPKPTRSTPPPEWEEPPPAVNAAPPAAALVPAPATRRPSSSERHHSTPTPTPGRDRPTPPPGSNRPTPPPPARSRPQPPPAPPRNRGPEPQYVAVTPQPARRPTRGRRPGRRAGPRRWRMVLPIVALISGAAIGLTWGGTGPGPTPPATGPASDAAIPPASPPADPPQTVIITDVRDDGDAVRLAWIDPTSGQAQFVVSQIFDDAPARVYSVPPGQNETVIADLDPDATRYCFKVLAVLGGPDEVATSAVTCTGQRNPT